MPACNLPESPRQPGTPRSLSPRQVTGSVLIAGRVLTEERKVTTGNGIEDGAPTENGRCAVAASLDSRQPRALRNAAWSLFEDAT